MITAEARCDSQIKEAIAEEQRMASRFLNDTEIAKAQRDFEIKKAAYDVEVQTKKAEAEMAFELQAAKTKQRIKEEQMQIKVVERTQEIAVQDQEMIRRERELEATVHRPAQAEKYRLEKIAEANRNRVILEAEAEAESVIHFISFFVVPITKFDFFRRFESVEKLRPLQFQLRQKLKPNKWLRKLRHGGSIVKPQWLTCYWKHYQRLAFFFCVPALTNFDFNCFTYRLLLKWQLLCLRQRKLQWFQQEVVKSVLRN